MIIQLFINSCILITFISLYFYLVKSNDIYNKHLIISKIVLGIGAGIVGILLMKFSVQVSPNIITDFRALPILLCSIFGGFIPSMIYVVVFVSLAIALANTNSNPGNSNFLETKINIAFINYDTNSKIVEGLRNYLSKDSNIVDIPDDTQKLQDALFFRQVEYIVKVPKGFTEGLSKGEAIQLEKTTVPNSTSAIYVDSIINKYLNTAKTYMGSMSNLSQEQLISYIDKDMA